MGHGCLGAVACLGITIVAGMMATAVAKPGLLLFIVPGIIAPATGFVIWHVSRSRWPWAGRGAVIFGTVCFLITATCYLALVGSP